MAPQADVIYALDTADVIVGVNDAWDRFAAENQSGSLTSSSVVGRRLWDFIAGSSTRAIYRQLFRRVRGGSGPMRFAFRCDSPDVRRLLEMRISRASRNGLDVIVRTLRLESRPAVPLLARRSNRSEALLRLCSWCQRIEDYNGQWHEIEAAVPRMGLMQQPEMPSIAQGMCKACYASMTAMFDGHEFAASGDVQCGADLLTGSTMHQ